jgi:hypothetical protein
MVQEIDDKQKSQGEKIAPKKRFLIIKGWDKTVESLQRQPELETLIGEMGFDLSTLVEILNKEFPKNMVFEKVNNANGEKIEDVVTEKLMVNGRPLDRLLVKALSAAANSSLTEMTRFKTGGEAVLVTEGEADITYATVAGRDISKSDLITEKVRKGDLMISTDTPNNWSKIYGDTFAFIYIVGIIFGVLPA